MTSSIISFSTWSAVLGQYLLTSSLFWLTVFFNPHTRINKFSRKNRTIMMVSVIKYWRDFVVSHCQRTCFNAGITGMTCGDVAETSLSDLAGLAQYCSRRARLQLLKQHSSTIPRFWERRLFDLLVGRPAEIQMKIMSLRHFRIVLVTFQTKSLNYVIIYSLLILNLCYKPLFCPCNEIHCGLILFWTPLTFVAWTVPEFFKISRSSEKLYAVLEGHEAE